MKIGIIKETKQPLDKRVALSPLQCTELQSKYPQVQIFIESSNIRCFSDQEYRNLGLPVVENLPDCDLYLGIKEVNVDCLVSNKTYMFFTHITKGQLYNQSLAQALLSKRIEVIDYERIIDKYGNRVIAFGRFAGLVGAYNTLRAISLWNKNVDIPPAHTCRTLEDIHKNIKQLELPAYRLILTGHGRVGKGAKEIIQVAGFEEVDKEIFCSKKPLRTPQFIHLNYKNTYRHKYQQEFSREEFFSNPQNYYSDVMSYLAHTDVLVAGSYWNPQAPRLFEMDDLKSSECQRLKIISDITCDIDGYIPCNLRPSTIENPFYDYDRYNESEMPPFSSPKHITMMTIDNLPNELPLEASLHFGSVLISKVLPEYISNKQSAMIQGATITQKGNFCTHYCYLENIFH